MLGLLNFSFLNTEKEFKLIQAIKIIMHFLHSWCSLCIWMTPCIGPVLGSIIALSATEATISRGILLLSFYFFRISYTIYTIWLLYEQIFKYQKRFWKILWYITKSGGAILFITGILITTNYIQA